MAPSNNGIYDSMPLRGLRKAAFDRCATLGERCVGSHGLVLGAVSDMPTPATSAIGCWVKLWTDGSLHHGDLRASTAEPLPFGDHVFAIAMLAQAIERASHPHELLRETCRVLAPDGLLLIAGLHPFSAWHPWLRWHARGHAMHAAWPFALANRLLGQGFDVETVERVGPMWPAGQGALGGSAAWLGGGYLLAARKRRAAGVRVIKLQPIASSVQAGVPLSTGARRSAAAGGQSR